MRKINFALLAASLLYISCFDDGDEFNGKLSNGCPTGSVIVSILY